MPELPDVECFRRYAKVSLGRRIGEVSINKNRVLRISESTLRSHLLGNKFTSAGRHGKYMFMRISDGYELVLHFGMTGYLSYGEEIPEHSVFSLEMAGKRLSFVCVRKLGKAEVIKDRDGYIKKKGLGPDALSVNRGEFVRRMRDKRGSIKGAFMDQGVMAGVGNIYSDEVFYQAGVHPKRETGKIEDLDGLYRMMIKVIKTAIKAGADPAKIPENYLLRRREEGAGCGICGGKIRKTRINGRGVYYCPKHQK